MAAKKGGKKSAKKGSKKASKKRGKKSAKKSPHRPLELLKKNFRKLRNVLRKRGVNTDKL